MKKLAVLCISALGAALLVLGTAPAASAYPEVTCTVNVSDQVVKPGQRFSVTGSVVGTDAQNHAIASTSVHWTFDWNGLTKARTGSPVTVPFKAPQANKTRVVPLTVKSTSPGGDCVRHFDITVIGPTSVAGPHAGGGGLPSTGGPMFWLLVAGLVLLLGGGGAALAARRRSS